MVAQIENAPRNSKQSSSEDPGKLLCSKKKKFSYENASDALTGKNVLEKTEERPNKAPLAKVEVGNSSRKKEAKYKNIVHQKHIE